MSLAKPYGVGLRNVGSYQVSGHPYLSGSITSDQTGSAMSSSFDFPFVSKKIILTNNDSTNNAIVSFAPYLQSEAASFGYTFSASGSGNWLLLSASSTLDLDAKCKQIFVAPFNAEQVTAVDFVTVYAELTNITASQMYSLDGIEGVTTTVPITRYADERRPYGVGLRNVGSYQVSGQPYITGSFIESTENEMIVNQEINIKFPYVTKTLQLWNHSLNTTSRLRMHFAESGSIYNCKELYLSAVGATTKWKLYASLTNIPTSSMYTLSGSGINYP